jgi:hypothetical protein
MSNQISTNLMNVNPMNANSTGSNLNVVNLTSSNQIVSNSMGSMGQNQNSNNNSLIRSIGNFRQIENVPLNVAKKIYLNDMWFDNDTTLPSRFVSITNENGNLIIDKKNSQLDGYYQVSKVKNIDDVSNNNIGMMNKQNLINMCFSVWGNKGPYEKFISFYIKNDNTFPENKIDRAFLAHLAWAMSNEWSLGNDPVVQKILEIAKMTLDTLIEFLKTTDLSYESLLSSDYARAYNTFISDPLDINEHTIRGMIGLDKTNAELYIDNIKHEPLQTGGRKRLTRTKKANIKSRKSRKSRKN